MQCKADDLPEAETAEILALSEMKSAMREAKKVWTKKQLAQAGAIVNAHVAMVALLHRLILAECHSHIGAGVRPDGGRNDQEKAKPAISECLLHSLTAHRTAAVAADRRERRRRSSPSQMNLRVGANTNPRRPSGRHRQR